MKFKIIKKIFFVGSIITSFFCVMSLYNFVIGFSTISTIKTNRYNTRRAQYSKMLEDSAEPFGLTTEDNIRIAGLVIDRPTSDTILLICHGYKQSKEHLIALANLFDQYTVVLFDLRAHGDSGGSLVSFGYHEYKEVTAVFNFLKHDSRFKNKKIYGLGISMGAASIANAASRSCKFDGLILDSCFSGIDFEVVTKFVSVPKIFYHFGKFLFKHLWHVDIDSIKPGKFLSAIECPVMILHSEKDEKISVSHAYELYSNISCPTKALVLSKGVHGQLFMHNSDFYKKTIIDFLSII